MHTTTPQSARTASPHRRLRRRRAALLALLAALTCATVPAVASAQVRPPATASPPGGRVAVPPTTPPTVPPTTAPPTTQPPVTVPPITPVNPPDVFTPDLGPAPDCTTGQNRPTGTVPPGYVYSPTSFSGSAVDPQPDDTFVADAPGHTVYTGRLTTRTFAGREEFLVCAHVGTNTPDAALTAFATTGPGAHPATLTARVVIINAAGVTTSYDIGDPRLSASAVFPYRNATDPGEGFAGAWIPFTPALREPGFTVRVEVRGTPATPGGGTGLVMGADEVFVHLGPSPFARNQRIPEAVGVALDDGLIGERSGDPGADDLSSLFGPTLSAMVRDRIAAMTGDDISGDWDWGFGLAFGSGAGGSVDAASFLPTAATLDLVPIDGDEARLNVHVAGRVNVDLTLKPRSFGLVSYYAGTCGVDASVDMGIDLGFIVNLSPDRARPVVEMPSVTSTVDTASLSSQGTLWAASLPPFHACSWLNDDFESGIEERINDKLAEISAPDGETRTEILDLIEAKLAPADLTNGPIAGANVQIPGGSGFGIGNARWTQTAPSGQGHRGGAEWIHAEGMDLAAELAVTDQGGTRFPYTYRPTASSSVLAETHARQRTLRASQPPVVSPVARAVPGGVRPPVFDNQVDVRTDFDIGMVVNGATVNQLLRALTAGRPVSVVGEAPVGNEVLARANLRNFTTDSGLLDIATRMDADGDGTPDMDVTLRPAVSPLYLPTPPSGWPVADDVNLFVPSMRIAIPVPHVATMATDIRIGARATIDTTTNRLLPRVNRIDVQSRFLRLGTGLNSMPDPAQNPIVALVTQKIRDAIPPRVAAALTPIGIPDLKSLFTTPGFTPVVLSRLSVRTVGGGHLGVHLDVDPNPARVGVTTSFTGGSTTTPPGSLTVTALPTAFPSPTAGYTVRWTIRDATTNALIYQSTSDEPGLTKTISATGIAAHIGDPCFGDRSVTVKVTAVVARGNVTATATATGGASWVGQPTRPAKLCNQP